jgi:hypothetical protein
MRQTKDKQHALHEIAVEFHQRAFGEEMARVNFLPVAERRKYLARVRARAAKKRHRREENVFLTG